MDINENKRKLYRAKALKHYYENIDYYRNYYILNKDKLLIYSKNYRNKKKIEKSLDLENTSPMRKIFIQYGEFIVDFD